MTSLTDLADFPPHFWMERQDQYLICGTDRAVEQAFAMGYARDRVFQTSGMILRPAFYDLPRLDRPRELQKLGLRSEKPTALILFGSEGSNAMFPIVKHLGNSDLDLQLVAVCGRNHALRKRLAGLKTKNPILLEGFTKEISRYMQLADFLIGKPGPGSISEALHMGLPVIVERNAWTLPQERYNAQWLAEKGLGVVLPSFRRIENAVARLLEPHNFAAFKQRIGAMRNRAVYEIPPMLENILAVQSQSSLAKVPL